MNASGSQSLTGEQVDKKLRDIMQKLNLRKKSEDKLAEIRSYV